MAQEWAASYKATHPDGGAVSLAPLRAYHLWYHQNYDVPKMTGMLRDPPLKYSTVIDYVCEAVAHGSLPAEQERLAKLSTYGVQPYKSTHQRLLQSAGAELEQKKHDSSREA